MLHLCVGIRASLYSRMASSSKIYDALNPWVIMNSTIATTPKNSLTPTLSTFLIASMIHMANLLNQLTIVKLKYNNYLLRKQQITTSKGSFIGLKKFLLSWFKMETLEQWILPSLHKRDKIIHSFLGFLL